MQQAYDLAIRTAERMARAGAMFEQVEEYVDRLELTDKKKTVVWLMAWAKLPRADRLRIIERTEAGIKVG